jgi:hypothetical protein
MYIHLPIIKISMYIQHLVKDIFPHTEDTQGIYYQITILMLYNINSGLVPFLKFIYVSVQISDIFVLVISLLFPHISFNTKVYPKVSGLSQ